MDVVFYLRSDGKYIILGDAVMAVFLLNIILHDVLMASDSSCLLKIRCTIYFSLWHCHGCIFVDWYTVWRSDKTVGVLFYLRSDGQYIFPGDTVMAVLLLIIILWDVLINSDSSFLLKVRWTIYFTWGRCHGCVFVDYYTFSRSDRTWIFSSTEGQMDNIFYLATLSWLCFCWLL